MCSKWSKDDAKIVREMILKENEFINHRLTWLAAIQALLFTALGVVWEKAQGLINLLGVIGIAVSITSFVGLLIAHKAISKLRSEWKTNRPTDYVGPDVIGYSIPNKCVDFVLPVLLPWFVLPWLFVGVWICVLVKHCNRA